MVEESGERKGFWGSTLSKLKSALSKTKTQIVGSIGDEELVDHDTRWQEAKPEGSFETPVHDVPALKDVSYSDREQLHERLEETIEIRQETPAPEQRLDHWQEVLDPEEEPIIDELPEQRQQRCALEAAPYTVAPAAKAAAAAVSEAPRTVQTGEHLPVLPIDHDFLEDLEEQLIKADIGLANVQNMISHMRKESKGKEWTTRDVVAFLKKEFQSILKSAPSPELRYAPGKVNIYLIVGVNGTGKTTSLGKLSWRFKQEGKKVLLAAGDTFRAAAESQLEIWSERAGVDIVRLGDNADPGAVVFTALDKAKKENYDCVLIDTAGRLHNKANLMAELAKIRGVVEKHGQGLPLECLLVLDASTGQNGLQQAKLFTEVCKLTGVILTKLDGTAKGGVVFSIARDLKIPVKLIGLGEKMDELRDFEPELFVEALF